MSKIAVPVIDGKLNQHFGHTQNFFVYEVEDNRIVKEEKIDPPAHQPGLFPKFLSAMGVTDVIASGMGQKAIVLFNQNKINVFVGVPVKEPQALVQDLLDGVLETRDNSCNHETKTHSCNH